MAKHLAKDVTRVTKVHVVVLKITFEQTSLSSETITTLKYDARNSSTIQIKHDHITFHTLLS